MGTGTRRLRLQGATHNKDSCEGAECSELMGGGWQGPGSSTHSIGGVWQMATPKVAWMSAGKGSPIVSGRAAWREQPISKWDGGDSRWETRGRRGQGMS